MKNNNKKEREKVLGKGGPTSWNRSANQCTGQQGSFLELISTHSENILSLARG